MPRKAHPIREKHEICARLYRIATGRGLTPYEIAKIYNLGRKPTDQLNYQTVKNVLTGDTRCPRIDTITKIVEALDAAWMTIIEQRDHSAEVTNLSIRRRKRAT